MDTELPGAVPVHRRESGSARHSARGTAPRAERNGGGSEVGGVDCSSSVRLAARVGVSLDNLGKSVVPTLCRGQFI